MLTVFLFNEFDERRSSDGTVGIIRQGQSGASPPQYSKWLASKLAPDNYGANSRTKSETDLNQMYLEALQQLRD